jgi:type IV secretory pathway ATPase VirB11/archaellum biosynthesis ATPase
MEELILQIEDVRLTVMELVYIAVTRGDSIRSYQPSIRMMRITPEELTQYAMAHAAMEIAVGAARLSAAWTLGQAK